MEGTDSAPGCVVTVDGRLLMGRLGGSLQERATPLGQEDHLSCMAWSPDGSAVALGGRGPRVVVQHFDSGSSFFVPVDTEVRWPSASATSSLAVRRQSRVGADTGDCDQEVDVPAEDAVLSIDSLAFVGPGALWVAVKLRERRDGVLQDSVTLHFWLYCHVQHFCFLSYGTLVRRPVFEQTARVRSPCATRTSAA